MATMECAVEGAVRRVLINRPEKRNALDGEMLVELTRIFREPPAPQERVAVIRSAGSVFCAGLDLRARAGMGQNPIEPMLRAVEEFPLPVVAVVQGDAIAGGNELALHCDLVVASTAARFGMSHAQLGIAPTWYLARKIIELAGPVVTRQIFLLGDPIAAARFHELGVIAHLAEPAALEETAASVIDRLARNAPLSLKAVKLLLRRDATLRDGIPHDDIDRFAAEVRQSADAREGTAARLEKREPRFEGR
jgi:enoyl-CoA hydratase/carnithine racemase